VKQKTFTIRNLQNSLTQDLTKLEQTYNTVQHHSSITSLNNRIPNNVKITNKVEEFKLEIKYVDSNSSTNGQTITISFNEKIPSNLKGRVEQLEKIPNEISNINNSFLLKYSTYDHANNKITLKNDSSSSNDVKKKIDIPFGINLVSDSYNVKFLENKVLDCINIDKGLNLNVDKDYS
jgi:hypothetical protein